MADLQEFKEHFILLCEAGFIAVNQTDEDAANKLFRASELLKPENTLPKVGEGYMQMMKLQLMDACKTFDQVIAKEPDNEMAKTFLGLSYSLTATEVAKGEKLLTDMVEKGEDEQIKTLAVSALDFVDKFIKKAPSPLDPKMNQPKPDKPKTDKPKA